MYKAIHNDPIERAITTYTYTWWDGAFSNDDIKNILNYCDTLEKENATILGTNDEKETEKTRVSTIKFVKKNDQTSWIFDRFNGVIEGLNEKFYNYDLNGYDSFQYTEYDCEKLGKYDWHQDMLHGYNTLGYTRKLSIVMNLTEPGEDYEGGRFQFNIGKEEEPETIYFPKGRIVAFPSYTIHRVTPVMRGIRKSIVIWVLGPKFI